MTEPSTEIKTEIKSEMTTETQTAPKRYYVTTPIYYVNGLPHVGTALTTVACDVLIRYHRLRGYETWFLTGTDENGTKIQVAAEEAGQPTQAFVDGLAEAFRAAWQDLHVSFDDLIRTTEPRHVRAVQEFFRRLLERGYVYKDVYEGWYSVSDETFYRDSDVRDGIAIETGKPVVRETQETYFFRLSAFGERLRAHIEANPGFLLPEFRRNETLRFIEEGLRDMSITRVNRGWGITFPGDDSKVIYVWFDALISYLSATGWPDNPDWERTWPADVHFMGKEIFVRFHATLWPAMLMALDLPLPKQVFGHGFWTIPGLKPGEKAGKSTGGLPHPTVFSEFIAARTGISFDMAADAQRYLLCREMNFGLDTEFTVENCLRRYNTDLANDLGNLLNRTVNMVKRYFDGVVPQTAEHDSEIAALGLQVQEEYMRAMAEFRLNAALEAAWKLVARMNKYIDEKAPWTLAKGAAAGNAAQAAQLAVVLYTCLEATRHIALLVSPVIPLAASAICAQLGIEKPVADARWEDLVWGGLPAGTRVGDPQPVFPRIQELAVDDDTLVRLGVLKQAPTPTEENGTRPEAKLEEKRSHVSETTANQAQKEPGAPVAPTEAAPEATPIITIDDFMKVELKVGEILAAEPAPNATKLLRLTVQVGEDDTRTILSGIAEHYKAEDLVGTQVVVITNLQPRKMRGIESQGMLLAADDNGKVVLVRPEQVVGAGSKVR
jgi:methionyl-tRNA synthetase